MKILAIDSSAVVGSAAICDGDRLIGMTTLNTGNTHSETLLVTVNELLEKAKLTPADIELFACSDGPGSFTGIRIGVSLIKGLAFGREKCCIGVSTLEALAYNLHDREGIICPVMDARRAQLYNALFVSDGKNVQRITDDRLISADELGEELKNYSQNIYFCGDGVQVALKNISLANIRHVNKFQTYQSAYSVAMCALEHHRNDGAIGDNELLPKYLRASQAERERNEKEMRKNQND